MGLCLGTCSISIKTQTKSTAGWLCSIRLLSVVVCPPTQWLSSCRHALCHHCHCAMVNVPPPPPPHCSSLLPCHLLMVYPVVVVSCHTPSLLCRTPSLLCHTPSLLCRTPSSLCRTLSSLCCTPLSSYHIVSCHVVVVVFVVIGMPFVVGPCHCGIC